MKAAIAAMGDVQWVKAVASSRLSLVPDVFAARTRPVGAPSWLTLGVVIALHVVAIAWLLQPEPVREALREVAPVFVNLVALPEPVLPRTPPPAPKPRPRAQLEPEQRPIAAPLPLLSTANEPASPERFEAPRAEFAPLPPIEAPRASPAPSPPIQAAPVRDAAPAARLVIPPSFSAAYLNNPPPVYPALSRRMGEQGRVLLRVLVSAHGRAEAVELKESSGSQRLDNAALEAVRQWRFNPARQGEKALAAWVLVPILFRLEG